MRLVSILRCRLHLRLARWHGECADRFLDRTEALRLARATRRRPSGPLVLRRPV
jgi:hypothetical protein